MREIKYQKILNDSIKQIKKEPIILTPLLLFAGIVSLWILFVLIQLLLLYGFMPDLFSYNYDIPKIMFISTLSIFNLFILFVIKAYFIGMILGGIKRIISYEKNNMQTLFNVGKKYFKRVFQFELFKLIVLSLPIIIPIYLWFVNKKISIIIGVVYLIYFCIFDFILLFVYPIMILNDFNLKKLLSNSMNYAYNNLAHTIFTCFTLIVFYITSSVIIIGISELGVFFNKIMPNLIFTILKVILIMFSEVIQLIVYIIMFIFIFKAYQKLMIN